MIARDHMRFTTLDHYFTGVAIPVAALRSKDGCGVGEFADLPALGEWCRKTGLDVIQVLPVNDTGGSSSPYSAISAFALHPLYLRLQDLPGAEHVADDITRFRAEEKSREAGKGGRFSYREVLDFKIRTARRIFDDNGKDILGNPELARWRQANPWVVPYAVFCALKRENNSSPWVSWGALANPSPEDIAACWRAREQECLFVSWVQMQLERQLSAASRSLQDVGVFLKGDVPILMSEESVDVWASRRFFDLSAKAGAPPDMFSPSGQNWGFPVYDWESLASNGYRWWKDRLLRASRFFHALRIDHVLGFFRIWRIPRTEVSGLLGRFSPFAGLSKRDLDELAYDSGRIRWLTLPHVSGEELEAALHADAGRVAEGYLSRIGNENLYNIRAELDSETAIHALPEPQPVKDFLLSLHADRTLLDDGTGMFFTPWYLDRKKGYRSLSESDRTRLNVLLSRRRAESEEIWEKTGRALLAMLKETTDMLVCAEDLGDVPDCVPRVLAGLGILGLRIVRWSREYGKAAPGSPAPFIPPARYARFSVCTPSVHDTSTLRGWWEEDAGEREAFSSSLGLTGPCPQRMTPVILKRVIEHCLGAGSLLAIFQIQDLLDLDTELWSADPRGDRINVPGTVTEENWTWRMPLDVESLAGRRAISAALGPLVAARRARRLDGSLHG
ncbi:MAG TPA: 4-alpha-glucanotransferase [Spirochaetia bacterium]|nr:4-alpha-glucanotransferase [Spirochaetia bacterium]